MVLEPDPGDGGYTVYVPALPGCVSQGGTRDEALANVREAIALHLESLWVGGLEVPREEAAPVSSQEPPQVVRVKLRGSNCLRKRAGVSGPFQNAPAP